MSLKSAQQLLIIWLLYVFETKVHKDHSFLSSSIYFSVFFLTRVLYKWGIYFSKSMNAKCHVSLSSQSNLDVFPNTG